jgi:hypothetical protein
VRNRRPDPFAVLGLAPDATADEIRQARNRLAKQHHPDVGGSPDDMRVVNEAAAAALARLAPGRASNPPPHSRAQGRPPSSTRARHGRIERDHPSFTIEALPAEAFEALVLAARILGDLADDEPPYRLDMVLDDPRQVWCRAELVPDGGGSTVSLTVATPPGEAGPVLADSVVYEVRDRLLDELNALDWTSEGPRRRLPS